MPTNLNVHDGKRAPQPKRKVSARAKCIAAKRITVQEQQQTTGGAYSYPYEESEDDLPHIPTPREHPFIEPSQEQRDAWARMLEKEEQKNEQKRTKKRPDIITQQWLKPSTAKHSLSLAHQHQVGTATIEADR